MDIYVIQGNCFKEREFFNDTKVIETDYILEEKTRLLGRRQRDRKMARRAKKRLQEPKLRRARKAREPERPGEPTKWLQDPELRWRGEPERPESRFSPKKKMGGGKRRTGGNNIYTILCYNIVIYTSEA